MNDMPMIPSSGTPSPVQGGTLQTDRMARDPERSAALAPEIVKALSTVYDPEIPINIYDLGLIYDILVDGSNAVGIKMTLTAPACPAWSSTSCGIRRGAATGCRTRHGCSLDCSEAVLGSRNTEASRHREHCFHLGVSVSRCAVI